MKLLTRIDFDVVSTPLARGVFAPNVARVGYPWRLANCILEVGDYSAPFTSGGSLVDPNSTSVLDSLQVTLLIGQDVIYDRFIDFGSSRVAFIINPLREGIDLQGAVADANMPFVCKVTRGNFVLSPRITAELYGDVIT